MVNQEWRCRTTRRLRAGTTGATRRSVLARVAGVGVAAVGGCTGRSDGGSERVDADVIVGPGGRLEFSPGELQVDAGTTVTWFFESTGHNVSGRPEDSEAVRLPDGAEPFSSYDSGQSPLSLVPAGESFEHAFDVAGTHAYVCIPHVGAGMVGRVVVEE